MLKKIKSKYKKDEKLDTILVAITAFYLILSIVMIIGSSSILMDVINKTNFNLITQVELFNTKIDIMSYMIMMFIIGLIILIGSLAGVVGIVKKNINWSLFSILVLISTTTLFVICDGYYCVNHNSMSYYNYLLNVLATVAGAWLLIIGYKRQKNLTK